LIDGAQLAFVACPGNRWMIDYKAFSVYCATCQHWTGERRPDRDDWRVYTPRHATIGTCACPTGHWRGRLKPGESDCKHWSRWEAVLEDPPGQARPRTPDPKNPLD
jgi:hypothetical protein